MKAVVLDKSTLGNIDFPKELLELADWDFLETTESHEVASIIKNKEIVLTNKVVLGKEELSDSNVKYIGVLATGTNNIDLDYCKKNNIVVKNAFGYSTDSVAQHTFSMLFSFLSKSHYFDAFVKESEYANCPIFTHFGFEFSEIKGKVWGIIGMGAIGRKVAEIASVFGVEIVYYSSSNLDREHTYSRLSLDELAQKCDFISIHAPLNEKTSNLVNISFLEKMKPSAILLNLGRGGIVNEEDLIQALNQNMLLGACLDVFESEPFDFKEKYKALKDKNKLLLSPHIAWASVEARKTLLQITLENLTSWTNK